jgi:hypothetical protein
MHIHPVFHVSLLERYYPSNIPGRTPPIPPPVEIDGDEEYEVEGILDAKWFGKGLKFLVKWKGYSDIENSWEPEKNLTNCQDLLNDFKIKYPSKLKKEAKKGR